jgi:uncharacterized membrane protein
MHVPRGRPTFADMSSRARLSRTARRWWLVAHILCGVGWMGADVILALLVVTAQTTGDGATVSSIYTVLRLVIPWTVPFLAVGMLVTGVVLGWGTRYGLVQWWWVLVKLSVAIVLTVLVFVALVPGALSLPEGLAGTAEQVREAAGDAGTDLMFPPFVSFAALAFALVLSVFKPWGRTRWARRQERDEGRAAAPREPARR